MYHLHREQWLDCTLDEAWEFFSSPSNLDRLTPDAVGFEITHLESEKMHPGQMIAYRVKIAPLFWVKWVTEITHVDERRSFVDDQRVGPYRLWHHTHRFEERDGGVLMVDDVCYEMPFGPLGVLVHKLFVRERLGFIFDERRRLCAGIFGGTPVTSESDE